MLVGGGLPPPREHREIAYLVLCAANWPFFPFGSAQIHQLLPYALIRLLSQPIVDTGELFAEETLRAAMVAYGASPCLVFWGIQLISSRETCEKEDPGQCQGSDSGHIGPN